MIVPQEIRNRVLSMFLEGKSEEEIMKLSRLSEDQVHNILSELDFSENRNTLSYLLAVKYGKNGRDTKEYAEIIDAKQILVRHGVLPKDVVRFITNLAEFFETTDLDADLFIRIISVYHKLTRSMSIKTYQELRKRKLQLLLSLQSFWDDEEELQERYGLLTKGSGRKYN
jgi:uncharacterized Fe-S radical SAM superfamily protein PflX